VVILSFFVGDDQGTSLLILGLVVALGVAFAVGLTNGLLIRGVGMSPVVTTLTTYIAIQGVSLLLRPTPDGYFRSSVTDMLVVRVGPFPVAFLVAVVVVILCEILLRKSRYGMELRAIGSNETAAHRLGAFAGVILIEEITSATGFLGLGSAWQYWLPGLLILLAAGAYSRSRLSGGAHRT
jgi:ribose transport system ATP-binding protein